MKRIIVFISILIIAYLAGSFFSVSFNISEWTSELRETVVIFGLFSALVISSFPYIDEIFK